MKLPKNKKRYCPYCKKHTEHKVAQSKRSGSRGTLKHGSIPRGKKRGLGRGHGNLGRWGSKPAKPKRTGKKSTKKTDLRYECKECKKSHMQKKGFRAKRVEFK